MIKVANAPCSWGSFELNLDTTGPECDRVLDEMASAGYAGTELGDWGFMPTDAAALAATLERRRLSLVGGFVPVALSDRGAHAAGRDLAVRTAALMAAVAPDAVVVLSDDNCKDPVRTRNAGRIRPEHGLDDARWAAVAAGAELVARAVREETGLRTVFHHHCGGFVETPAEVDRLLALTDPTLVGLCLDTGHYTWGGGDALAAARRHADRLWHVHFKDCDPRVAEAASRDEVDYFEAVKRGIFCELGRGQVAFGELLEVLRSIEYDGWIVVEQDVFPGLGAPFESARHSRAYLRELGL